MRQHHQAQDGLARIRSNAHPLQKKVCRTRGSSHPSVTGSNRSSTVFNRQPLLGVIGRRVHSLGNQGSSHIFTLLPFPTRQIMPFFRTFTPCKILRQVYDIPPLLDAFSTSPWGKYFARKTCAQRDVGSCTSLHACLASIAKLKVWISLNPNPP